MVPLENDHFAIYNTRSMNDVPVTDEPYQKFFSVHKKRKRIKLSYLTVEKSKE